MIIISKTDSFRAITISPTCSDSFDHVSCSDVSIVTACFCFTSQLCTRNMNRGVESVHGTVLIHAFMHIDSMGFFAECLLSKQNLALAQVRAFSSLMKSWQACVLCNIRSFGRSTPLGSGLGCEVNLDCVLWIVLQVKKWPDRTKRCSLWGENSKLFIIAKHEIPDQRSACYPE